MSFKAVQGVLVTGRGCGTSLVVKAQRKVKSQLLPSNRFAASMDDTISKVWLRKKACAAHERTRSRTAALTTAEQLGLLSRMCCALLRHRRGSKAGRYYRRRHSAPKVLNLEELWLLTTCSASKSSGEAEVCGQMARAAAAKTAHDHSIGADRQRNCIQRCGDSIEMIL